MFSNQKKSILKSKVLYGCVIVLLIVFGIWLNYDEKDDEGQQTNTRTKVEETMPEQSSVSDSNQGSLIIDSRENESQSQASEEETKEEEQKQESEPTVQEVYYLVREIDGVVKVFHCNEAGEESLYEITSIPFSLLSNEDQQLFAEGVRLEDKAQLESFLENFDS